MQKNWISLKNNKKKLAKGFEYVELKEDNKKQKNNTMFIKRFICHLVVFLIGSTSLLLNGVKTTQSGRDDLLKIKESIYEVGE